MFERFTDRARRTVVLSHEEARLLRHAYIGTEHVLLGLIAEREGVAALALDALGISHQAVQDRVREFVGIGASTPEGHVPFTPRAKKVFELSLREALQLGHNYIGTEHILLGLIREGEGVAAQVLTNLGAELHLVRKQVIAILSGSTVATPEPGQQRQPQRLTRQIVVRVDAELDDWLDAVSAEDGRTKAQTVRWMLTAIMQRGMPQ